MPVVSIICDECGLQTGDFVADYDGVYRCKACDLKVEAMEAREEYIHKKDWLENTFLKDLENLRQRAAQLESRVKESSLLS